MMLNAIACLNGTEEAPKVISPYEFRRIFKLFDATTTEEEVK